MDIQYNTKQEMSILYEFIVKRYCHLKFIILKDGNYIMFEFLDSFLIHYLLSP